MVDKNLTSIGMRRVSGQRDWMNILGDERHRRGFDGRAAVAKAQHLGIVRKTGIELAGGDHLRDQDLRAAIV